MISSAIEVPELKVGCLVAEADYRTKQYYAVKVSATGTAELAGAGEGAIGFLRNKPNIGEIAEIVCGGIALAEAGDAITAGDELMIKAGGTVVTHTSTNAKVGVALNSGISGDVISVLVLTRSGIGSSANRSIMTIPIYLPALADGDIVTDFIPGFAGLIEKVFFITHVPASTAGKACTLNLEIEATNLTGGVVSLTTVACNTMGKVTYGTAITDKNAFSATQKISVEASATTKFIEGDGALYLVLKNS